MLSFVSKARSIGIPPVLTRELQARSHRPSNYGVRVLCAGILILMVLGYLFFEQGFNYLMGASPPARDPMLGVQVFVLLHISLCVFLFFTSPMLVADTLSREQREGTLGLLFLTPLQPSQVVWGKVFAHLLSMTTLWVSAMPVFLVPILLGGTTATDFGVSILIQGIILLGTTAGGILASSWVTRWGQATGLALLFSLAVAQAVVVISSCFMLIIHLQSTSNMIGSKWSEVVLVAMLAPWAVASGALGPGFDRIFQEIQKSFPAGTGIWSSVPIGWVALTFALALSFVFLWMAVRLATRRTQRAIRADTHLEVNSDFRMLMKPEMKRRLEKNPFFWLQSYGAKTRWNRWTWVALIGALWGIFGLIHWLGNNQLGKDEWFMLSVASVILLSVIQGFMSTASFKREHEEGVLELLLVTPLPAETMIQGRVKSIRSDFFWAFLLNSVLSFWVIVSGRAHYQGELEAMFLWLGMGWIWWFGVPGIGIRMAVRRLHPITGMIWVVFLGFLIPSITAMLVGISLDGVVRNAWVLIFLSVFGAVFLGLSRIGKTMSAQDFKTRQYMLKPLQKKHR